MAKKILIALLALSGLMPLFIGILCLFANDKALEFLKMTRTPDVYQLSFIFGLCALGFVVIYSQAIAWVIKDKREGYTLSKLIGAVSTASGILMLTMINRPDFGGPDLVKGILILAVAYWAERKIPLSA